MYKVDELAHRYGHKVVRLPPYHCIFNPIEHIWGIAKNYFRDNVGKDGSSVEKSMEVWKEALHKITPEVWDNTVRHTEEIIQNWWEREVAFDIDDHPPFIINLDEDDEEFSFDDDN